MMKSYLFWSFVAILSLMSVSLILQVSAQTDFIPQWVKNNAKLWSDGSISDSDFIKGIQYLIDTKILTVSQSAPSQMQDNGDFKTAYLQATNPQFQNFANSFSQNKGFDQVAYDLNKKFVLPYDVTFSFQECDQINSYYDPNSKQLVMCYDLVNYFVDLFSKGNQTNDEIVKNVSGATTFVFFHELGHALIDVYHLPSTGKEEDAVDQLSTILLLNSGDTGENALISTEVWFLYQGLQANSQDVPFWDEHSFDIQRFYNIACLSYGKDPQKYAGFVSSGLLPQNRAVKCSTEYQKAYDSWNTLLKPYVKISLS